MTGKAIHGGARRARRREDAPPPYHTAHWLRLQAALHPALLLLWRCMHTSLRPGAVCPVMPRHHCVTGAQGHAGTVPMSLRQDALAGAAEMTVALEAMCGVPEGHGGAAEVRPRGGGIDICHASLARHANLAGHASPHCTWARGGRQLLLQACILRASPFWTSEHKAMPCTLAYAAPAPHLPWRRVALPTADARYR